MAGFILSVICTIAVLFANSYQLSDDVIDKAITGQNQALKDVLAPVYKNEYSTSISFQSAYIPLLRAQNEQIAEAYHISGQVISAYLSLGQTVYSSERWDQVLGDKQPQKITRMCATHAEIADND